MVQRIKFVLQQIWYDLHTGLLLRPVIITVCLAFLSPLLIHIEEATGIGPSTKIIGPLLFRGEAGSAQTILSIIAGAMLTMVSIVYSILVMALTLASMQFSPRILHEFMRDKASQAQLGMFIGTFTYCLMTMRMMNGELKDSALQLATSGAIILTLVCLGHLIYFIHHISQGIQINYIIDLIADQTDEVIDDIYKDGMTESGFEPPCEARLNVPPGAVEIVSRRSGYIQLVDVEDLIELARGKGLAIFILRTAGDFAIEGHSLIAVHPGEGLNAEVRQRCIEAFDIGPVRTMQQDIEFGIRQIVDVALKAISPAVNDPTTAVTCIDHLTRILSKLSAKRIPGCSVTDGGRVLVEMRRTTFESAFNLAIAQIKQYGKSDMAVMTALMKMIAEVESRTACDSYRSFLRRHAQALADLAENSLSDDQRIELRNWKERLDSTGSRS